MSSLSDDDHDAADVDVDVDADVVTDADDEPAGVTQPVRRSVVVKTVSSELALVALAHHLQQPDHHHQDQQHQHHNQGHFIKPTVPIFPTTAQSL